MAELTGPLQLMLNSFLSGLGAAAGNFVVLKLLLGKLEDKMNKQKSNNHKE